MAGTKEGGLKAAATNKKKYGPLNTPNAFKIIAIKPYTIVKINAISTSLPLFKSYFSNNTNVIIPNTGPIV